MAQPSRKNQTHGRRYVIEIIPRLPVGRKLPFFYIRGQKSAAFGLDNKDLHHEIGEEEDNQRDDRGDIFAES